VRYKKMARFRRRQISPKFKENLHTSEHIMSKTKEIL
jgi:hypothetical protein